MDIVFYVPGVVLLLTVALKLSTTKESWRDPPLAASSALLLVGSLVCLLSAPTTIGAVNGLTGIANFSAALVYSGMSALSACYLVLMIVWRGGPTDQVGRACRLVVGVYVLVIIGIVVLFALADVPVERTRDLDTYYATTPYMREMIMLYLVFHTAATVALATMGLCWLREVRDLTRTGLTLIVVGALFDLSYQIAKYTAMAARWIGHDWDVLSTTVSPPLVAAAGLTVAAGFALPRVGPSVADNVRAWKRRRLLRPLWVEMRALRPSGSDAHWWDPPVVRLARQEIAILDGVLLCAPYLDDEIRRTAYAAARARDATAEPGSEVDSAADPNSAAGSEAECEPARPANPTAPNPIAPIPGTPDPRTPGARTPDPAVPAPVDPDPAEIVAEAAMLAAARVRMAADRSAEIPADMGLLRSVNEPHLMVGLAQALSSSPIVAEARRRAAGATRATEPRPS
ncbi:hypothetical protein ACFVT5_19670 [Streptomyces sp. NPDC058001]|uniref:hypothetical protein n=1 Tax=Streptomyces sp. NPDC058001 TaxID=3346300 RepID=UPI0036ED4191